MQKYLTEARVLLALAVPVIFAQIAQTAMGVVDTIMAGSVSATDMAAVAVGTSIWLPAILLGHGLVLALSPTVAHLNGAGRRDKIAHQVQQGFWLAAGVSVLIMAVIYNCEHIIGLMHNVDEELKEKAIGYLHAIMWGAPGYLFFQVLRVQCEGLSKTKPGMIFGFVGLMVNIPLNYIFIYGHFGAPALGGVGCGVATGTVYWVMFLMMRYYVKHAYFMKDIVAPSRFAKPDWATLKRLTSLGLPIGLALFFEVTLFAIVALLVSPLGIVAVASHQIALSLGSLMFVIPLSLGMATTIRVGSRLGESSVEGARVAARTSIFTGVVIACFTASLSVIFREQIAALYNDSPEVVALASSLMLLAAVYQISDAIQVIGTGVLRGYKDTRSIFYITFVAYWVLGLPIGYTLGLTDWVVPRMGPSGFWWGFIIGLTFAAAMVSLRIRWIQNQSSFVILDKARR
ncbi:multidrug resistance protein, MATE family [Ewingella americana]